MKWCWLIGHKWLYEYQHVVCPTWKNDWVRKSARAHVTTWGALPTGKRMCQRCDVVQ